MLIQFQLSIKILVGCSFSKSVLELTRVNSRACTSRSLQHSVGVQLVGSCLDRVDLEKEFYKKTLVCVVQILCKIDMLAQRPITLVLMMINSCSYSLLMILCLFTFSYLSRSQWCVTSTKVFWSLHALIQELAHQDHIQHSVRVQLVGTCLERVDLENEFYKKTSVCVVQILCKIDSVDMLKFTHTQKFQYVWLSV